jgi:hypothetical protein
MQLTFWKPVRDSISDQQVSRYPTVVSVNWPCRRSGPKNTHSRPGVLRCAAQPPKPGQRHPTTTTTTIIIIITTTTTTTQKLLLGPPPENSSVLRTHRTSGFGLKEPRSEAWLPKVVLHAM